MVWPFFGLQERKTQNKKFGLVALLQFTRKKTQSKKFGASSVYKKKKQSKKTFGLVALLLFLMYALYSCNPNICSLTFIDRYLIQKTL